MTSSNLPTSRTWIVAHIEWSNNELLLEKVEAPTWREAVQKHSKYPWAGEPEEEQPTAIRASFGEAVFQDECFDCDCMMAWIDITPTATPA
jgi:hypothetical protein